MEGVGSILCCFLFVLFSVEAAVVIVRGIEDDDMRFFDFFESQTIEIGLVFDFDGFLQKDVVDVLLDEIDVFLLFIYFRELDLQVTVHFVEIEVDIPDQDDEAKSAEVLYECREERPAIAAGVYVYIVCRVLVFGFLHVCLVAPSKVLSIL